MASRPPRPPANTQATTGDVNANNDPSQRITRATTRRISGEAARAGAPVSVTHHEAEPHDAEAARTPSRPEAVNASPPLRVTSRLRYPVAVYRACKDLGADALCAVPANAMPERDGKRR
jgi:hypothetical protein